MRDADWIELERLVDDAMKCWAIPGLAIAVVQATTSFCSRVMVYVNWARALR